MYAIETYAPLPTVAVIRVRWTNATGREDATVLVAVDGSERVAYAGPVCEREENLWARAREIADSLVSR